MFAAELRVKIQNILNTLQKSSERIDGGEHQTSSEANKGVRKKQRMNEFPLESLKHKLGRKSRLGGIAFIILSASLLIISYKFPNYVVEIDSVLAFAAGIILLYKNKTQSVQVRIVNRLLQSAGDTVDVLVKKSNDSTFYYVPLGEKVTDVVVIPRRSVDSGGDSEYASAKYHSGPIPNGHNEGIVPIGRSLAQLFIREMGAQNPTIDDLITVLPSIFSESFGLSETSNLIKLDEMSLRFTMAHSLLEDPCRRRNSDADPSVDCAVCSLIATLACFASKSEVKLESCAHDDLTDVSTIQLSLGASSGQVESEFDKEK